MEGTSKIVEEILDKLIEDISQLEEVDEQLATEFSKVLKGDKKVTAQKLEQIIYSEGEDL